MIQHTLPLAEEALVDCRTPEEWCLALESRFRGLKFSARTLRSAARRHGQFMVLGKTMLLGPEHVENIMRLEAELCHLKSTNEDESSGLRGELKSYRVANTTDKARKKLQKLVLGRS